jgi:F0F1-type ATP synthase assembly protein I
MEPPQAPEQQSKKAPVAFARQMAMATELPFSFAGPILVGGIGGALLDRWLNTAPLLMFVLGAAGFVAGLRELSRRMKSLEGGSRGKPKP